MTDDAKSHRKRVGRKPKAKRVARPHDVPNDWVLLPPGDPGLTRRVKAAGEHRVVTERRGRRTFSLGVWAPAETIARIRQDLEQERAEPAYQKRQAAAAKRRGQEQAEYQESFLLAVKRFLNFAETHSATADRLAQAVCDHATPVGSGTVARTKRIPIERRAEAAVIAWLRHQTTGYDQMRIPRVRGERRKVRRELAEVSQSLLEHYRRGESISPHCPIQRALRKHVDG